MDYGLYIHLPYCRSLCPYCAFAKAPLHHAEPERLLSALAREWELARAEASDAWREGRPRTVFVGGGTPTALDPPTLRRFLAWTRELLGTTRVREWTVEANPEGLTDEKLALLREGGVDRLSVGIQSLESQVLRVLGRIHSAERALDVLDRARAAGFVKLSADLMTGVPGETAEGFVEGLERVVARGVTHVSLYALQVEPGTPLHAKAARGSFVPLPDDAAAARYDDAARILERAGLSRYEVSSWAKPGFESRHNEGYWIRRPYLGLGPGAHSFDGRRRWGNEEDVTRYYETLEAGALPRLGTSEVSDESAREEVVFLGLRRARGVRRTAVTTAAPKAAASWLRWAEDAGAIHAGRARVRPTQHGLMTAVEALAELFALEGARERAASANGFHHVDSGRVLTAGEGRV